MDDLIEALTIFRKYKNARCPTHCEHDQLMIAEITRDEVIIEDQKRLDELGFFWSESDDVWLSFRYGSA